MISYLEGGALVSNLFEYLMWRGDVNFNYAPLNELDSLIFAELSYIPYDGMISADLQTDGISLLEVYEKNFEKRKEKIKVGAIFPEKLLTELLKMAAKSNRFKNVKIRGYVNDIDLAHEKQFSAMCFDITDDITYVVFRGTDDTIIGWKEDLNMALFTPVPAQQEAVDYLNEVVRADKKRQLYVGGHSKGGNLAVYSAFGAEKSIQDKIISVHNFDGPGFRQDFTISANENSSLVDRVFNYIPESAVIGSIFDTVGKRIYVKSTVRNGLFQHDAFTWINDVTTLTRVEMLSKSSIQFHNSLEDLVSEMSAEETADFVEAVYKICTANDSETLTDILSNKLKFINALVTADGKSKRSMWIGIKKIFKNSIFKKNKRSEK